MVLNKNRKNTTTVGLALRALELPNDFPRESKLSQRKSFQYHHPTDYGPLSWKNPALRTKKPSFETLVLKFIVPIYKGNVFFCFSSVDVLCCEATCGNVRACAGACSHAQRRDINTDARRAKTLEEGFLRFLL